MFVPGVSPEPICRPKTVSCHRVEAIAIECFAPQRDLWRRIRPAPFHRNGSHGQTQQMINDFFQKWADLIDVRFWIPAGGLQLSR